MLGLTTGNLEEAAIERAFIRQAAETVVLASREKLGAASPVPIGMLDEIDALMVEGGLPDESTRPYLQAGLTMLIA